MLSVSQPQQFDRMCCLYYKIFDSQPFVRNITLQTYFRYAHCKKVPSQLSREGEVFVFRHKGSCFVEPVTILQKAKTMLIVGLMELFLLIFCNCIMVMLSSLTHFGFGAPNNPLVPFSCYKRIVVMMLCWNEQNSFQTNVFEYLSVFQIAWMKRYMLTV